MIDPAKLLVGIPQGLRDPLIQSYRQIEAYYVEHRWAPSELNAGHFCEIVYTIIEGAVNGQFATQPYKPPKMLDACRRLESAPADAMRVGDRSLRVLIPRLLPILYEVRNNRGVGHVAGDVDANQMDATAVHAMASWIMAELVRIFHGVTTAEATESVEALVERITPLIWDVEGVKRVLNPDMPTKDQVLLILHQVVGWAATTELFNWVEYSNPSVFRSKVLGALHDSRLIEHDTVGARARISPLGIGYVELHLLKTRT